MIDLFAPVPQPLGNIIVTSCYGLVLLLLVLEYRRAERAGYEELWPWVVDHPRKARIYAVVFAGVLLTLSLGSNSVTVSYAPQNYTLVGDWRIGNMSVNEVFAPLTPNVSIPSWLNASVPKK